MKKLLLSSVALLGLVSVASAADLPRRSVAPAPAPIAVAPVFSWSGFYAGINGGYVWDETRAVLGTTTGLTLGQVAAIPTPLSIDDDGFTIGGHVGGNMQFGMFVAGLEADIAYTDIGRAGATGVGAGLVGTAGVLTAQSDLDFLGTVRGRLGLAFDRFMIYGTGGFAYGGVDARAALTFPGAAAAFNTAARVDDINVGWAAGVGGEFAITNNMVFGVEWLHYDLGRENVTLGTAAANATYRVSHEGDIVRGRLSFKF